MLGIVLILILKEGSSLFGIQKFIGKYGELVLGPALLLIGLFILFGGKLKLPSFGFKGNGEGLARKGNDCCRLSAARPFAIATALPVLIVAWILAFSVQHIGSFYGKMQTVQKWLNRIVGSIFAIIGLYYCVIMYL